MLTNLHLILAKVEAQYGVDSLPVPATDAILVSGLTITPVIEKNERNPLSASLSPFLPGKPRMGLCDVKFSAELKGSGAATTPPEVGPLLRACALSQAINASDVTYQPVSAGFESVTIYGYLDGELHKITGCMGSAELILEAGKQGVWNFTFQGLSDIPIDAAIPAGAAYDTTNAPLVESIGLVLDAYNPVASKLQVSLNNAIGKRADLNQAGGWGGVRINGRKPAGSIDPEAVARAAYDFWQKMKEATPVALSATVGAAAGNRLVLTAPKVVYDSLAWGDREGARIYDTPLSFGRNAGDDEVVFKFN